MRKAFNFYQSHWEQIKLLNDKQKLDLFNAICSVQFLEVNIDDVTFKDQISTLVWTGIKHSLNTSISGYVNKNKALDKEVIIPLTKGGNNTPMVTPCQQLKEEEEEKEEEKGKGELTLPSGLNIDAFNMWIEYKGSKYSKQGKTLSINKLIKYDKLTQLEMVETAIMNNWKGLFEINKNKLSNNATMSKREKTNSFIDDFFSKRETVNCEVIE